MSLSNRGNQEGEEAAVSVVSHQTADDWLIVALCRDLRIRMWSYKRQECLMCHSLVQQTHSANKLYSNVNGMNQLIIVCLWSTIL